MEKIILERILNWLHGASEEREISGRRAREDRAMNSVYRPVSVSYLSRICSVMAPILFVVFGLFGVNVEAWGKYKANVTVTSSPSTGGYVYVGTSSSCSASNCGTKTSDNASAEGGGTFSASGNITFYFCNNPKSGYVFKGWSTSETANSGEGANKNPYSKSLEATAKIGGGKNHQYYAIFARMVANTPAAGSTTSFDDTNVGEESGWKQIKIDHAHAGTVTISQSGNDGDFFVGATTGATTELSSFESTTETTRTLYVKFVPQNNGLRTCTLTVSSNNGLSSLTYYLSGTGYNEPSITWVDGNGSELVSGETTLSAGDVLRATCSTGQTLTYTAFNSTYFTSGTDGSGNPILTVREDISGTINSLTVTAHLDKNTNSYYAEYSEEFTLSVTNLTPQTIEWTDDISDLSNEDMPYAITLTAIAKNSKTGAATGQSVTYSMSANAYLSLSGNVLTVRALGGPVAITATVAGNENYAPVSVVKYATVINMTDPCGTADNHSGGSFNTTDGLTIYPTTPDKLTFSVKKSNFWLSRDLVVKEYNSANTLLHSETYTDIGTSNTTKTLTCQPTTVKIVFGTESKATYSYDVSNVSTTRVTTSSVSVTSLDYATDPGQSLNKTFTTTYSNIPVFLSFKSDEDAEHTGTSLWHMNTDKFGGCGKRGTQTITVTFHSNSKGDYTDKLYVRNNVGDLLHTINLTASVTAQEQFLDTWNISDTYNTTDEVTLSAATTIGNTDFTFSPTTSSPSGIVSITDAGVMSFTGSGTATIRAYQPGDDISDEFATTHNITINKVTPTIATQPTVAQIHYLDYLNNSQLSEGLATVTLRGVANTPVAGTFTWTNAGVQVTDEAGVHNYSVTFTPTDEGMYNPVTFSIPVTIERATTPVIEINNASVGVSRVEAGNYKTVSLTDLITALPAANPMATSDIEYTVKSVSVVDDAFSGSAATTSTGIISNTAKTFYATEVGIYTITASAPQTNYYDARDIDFTITVNKLQPSVYFSAEDTVYNVRMVKNAAIAVCEGETIVTPPMRYSSSADAVIKEQPNDEGTYNLVGVVPESGTADITATFTGNAYFLTANNVKTYIARAKFTPVFLIDGTITRERSLNVGGTALASFHYCLPYNDVTKPMTYDITPTGIIEYNPATKVITAVGPGTAKITFIQGTDAYRYEGSREFEFTVSHNATSLTLAEQVNNTNTMYVGDRLKGTLYTANTDEVPVTFSSTNTAVVNLINGELVALSEGEATVTFAMIPEGAMINKWIGCSQQKTIHVSKRANTLSANYTAITKTYGGSETFTFTASNTDYANSPISLEAVNNSDLVVIERVSDNSYLVVARHTEGTVTLRATQDANNEYVAATSQNIIFTIGKSNYHVPVDLNNTMYNDNYCCVTKEGTTSVDGSEITVGQSFGGGFDWNDKFVVFRFEGIPDKLTFKYRCYSTVLGSLGDLTNVRWYVQESSDGNFNGNSWSSSRTDKDSYESVSIQLQPDTRYVKLCYGGNYSGQFKNIHISERSELVAAEPATTVGTPYVFEAKPLGSDDSEKVFTMDWYNIDVVNVTSSDNHFTVAPSSFADYEDYGQQPITIVYHRSQDIGAHNATITVTNGTQTRYIYVKGETTKKEATLTWNADIAGCGFLLNPDEVTSDDVVTVSNGGDYTLTSSNTSIIDVVGQTLVAKAVGTATITASYAGSGDFYPAQIEQLFTVTNDTKQTITWDQSLMGLLLTDGATTLTATASSGGEIIYSVEEEGTDIVTVSGSTLTIAGTAGDTYVTATQAGGVIGGVTYAPISMTKHVHVGDPTTQCEDYAINNQSCTFASLQKANGRVFAIDGPAANRIYFSAYHDKASGTFWDNFEGVGAKNYGPLIVEEYRYYNNLWEWHEIFNQVVNKENYGNYSAVVDPSATKVRFSSNEEVAHHVQSISLRRRKLLTASETSIDAQADCNTLYSKTLQITYSGLDVLTATINGGFSINKETLGEGCGTYGTEEIVITLTPTAIQDYTGTLVITDNKTNEKRLEIPVTVEAQPISQTIINFNAETSYLTTDDVTFNASVLSGNAVYYTSSDENIATISADGVLSIVAAGEVTITAHCDAVGVYAAAPDVSRTFTIERVTPSVSVAPTASTVYVPANLSASIIDDTEAVMIDDKGQTVTGSFTWQNGEMETLADVNDYIALFIPDNDKWYNTAEVALSVNAIPREKTISWSLADNQTFYCYESITLDGVTLDALTGDTVNRLISYTSSNPEVATVNGVGTIIVNKTGTITITASSSAAGYYSDAETVTRTVTFIKATPIVETAPKAIHISVNQPLERSYFYNYSVVREDGETVAGNFVWDEPEHVETTASTYTFAAHFVPSNSNYYYSLDLDVPVRIVLDFWTFWNKPESPDPHSWDKVENWSNAAMPTDVTPDVTILGDLVIKGDKTLGSMLIQEEGSVTVTNDAVVSVKYDSYESDNGKYGDLIVEKGGTLNLETNVNVRNFILRSIPSDTFGIGTSGQIMHPELLNVVEGDVYFELEIPTQNGTGRVDEDASFGFAVPFPVSLARGDVARYEEQSGQMVWNSEIENLGEYAIAYHNSSRRASGVNGWRLYDKQVLYPGQFYMLGVASQATRYRFKKVADAPFEAEQTMEVNLYSDGRNSRVEDRNWNAIANPNLLYSQSTDAPATYAYLFMNGSYEYQIVNLSETRFPVGTPFFVQTPSQGSVTVEPVTTTLSPRRDIKVRRNSPVSFTFASALTPRRFDRMYLSAASDAEDEYQIGFDVVKMQSKTTAAKCWVDAYGKQLGANYAPIQDGEAIFPISLYAPQDGTYILATERPYKSEDLLLLKDGVVVWNFAVGAYQVDLNKGTDKSYIIVMRHQVISILSDEQSTQQAEQKTHKFIRNGMLYILRDGVLYDATGKRIEN